MATCAECKHYEPKAEEPTKGLCFGHEVPGDADAANCPAKAFTPKDE